MGAILSSIRDYWSPTVGADNHRVAPNSTSDVALGKPSPSSNFFNPTSPEHAANRASSRSPSPDILFTSTRKRNDPEVFRHPVHTINSDVFTFLEDGFIKGPASNSTSGLVHDFDEVRQAYSGRGNLQVLSANWGDFVRPVAKGKNALDFTKVTTARLQASVNRRYVDNPISRDQRPKPFTNQQLRLKPHSIQPDILLHGKVLYSHLEYYLEGPGGTPDRKCGSIRKNFTVRVPLEYALCRPLGLLDNPENHSRYKNVQLHL